MAVDTQIWWRLAERARRLAASLSLADAPLRDRYAAECEDRGRYFSSPLGKAAASHTARASHTSDRL